ncbi:restriction endonuclease [Paenibacillus sp. 1P03SA]|uniref:restriction endonuclease n=1 Tax=Paenibacillus sp. 1P03SA TaxID=3132294 RepID=UPI00399F2BE4
MNLLENINTDLSAEEFEIYCLELLNSLTTNLSECMIKHNHVYLASDGHYQLDGLIEFEVLGVKYKTVVECKKYKNKIKRSQIQILHDTIRSIGANKGIFISTSSFQKGAMDYAKNHGIALMQVVDGFLMTIQNSALPPWPLHFSIPKFIFAVYDLELYCPIDFIHGKKVQSLLDFLLTGSE